MPDQIVEVPGYGDVEFPESMSDADIHMAIARLTKPRAQARLDQQRDDKIAEKFSSPYILPQSTVEGDPGSLNRLQKDPLTYAANVVGGIGQNAVDIAASIPGFLVNTLSAGAQNYLGGNPVPMAKMGQGIIDDYKRRYGGLENIAHTIETEPVSVALDVYGAKSLGPKRTPPVDPLVRVFKPESVPPPPSPLPVQAMARGADALIGAKRMSIPGVIQGLRGRGPAAELARAFQGRAEAPAPMASHQTPGIIEGMSDVGRRELADIEASQQMIAGMQPPPHPMSELFSQPTPDPPFKSPGLVKGMSEAGAAELADIEAGAALGGLEPANAAMRDLFEPPATTPKFKPPTLKKGMAEVGREELANLEASERLKQMGARPEPPDTPVQVRTRGSAPRTSAWDKLAGTKTEGPTVTPEPSPTPPADPSKLDWLGPSEPVSRKAMERTNLGKPAQAGESYEGLRMEMEEAVKAGDLPRAQELRSRASQRRNITAIEDLREAQRQAMTEGNTQLAGEIAEQIKELRRQQRGGK